MGDVLMSIDLIYQSMYEALTLSDASLQIWISITFAIIVAGHVAANRVKRTAYTLVSCLYAFYSSVLVLRYCSAAFQIIHYQELLLSRNMEAWPVPKLVGVLIGGGTFVLMVGGTITTLWFVRAIRVAAESESD